MDRPESQQSAAVERSGLLLWTQQSLAGTAMSDAIPDSSTDYAELTGNADKIMETVAFLEQLALSTNLYTRPMRLRESHDNPGLRRLREVYYHLMNTEMRQTRPNYDKYVTTLGNLQKAYKRTVIALGVHNYERLRLLSVNVSENKLRLEARQDRLDVQGTYKFYATNINELIGKPPPENVRLPLKDLPVKLKELENNLNAFILKIGLDVRGHNTRYLAENVWDWLKYAYRKIRPPNNQPLELDGIAQILTVAYFPDSLVSDRNAIVRLGEEYSGMKYVNAALMVVGECCAITNEWREHLKQRFFETVLSLGKRRTTLTMVRVGYVATNFLKSKGAQFSEQALGDWISALASKEPPPQMANSHAAVHRFATVLVKDPTKIPLAEIEHIEMIKGEAAQTMAKFVTIIDCNRRAMGNRYMDMIRQMHAATMPVEDGLL
ncbi:hypothetical protein QR680_000959 [Steinernema hermaphroditum]|uniref:Uncharacterized protein n=1 Tax=Steinernema hermaphroditum TaxID=289476 RepID=A0AA39GWH2_9BILA|nr:hypothetical protein QR680_000959 [Steinernema hermaphroditum]